MAREALVATVRVVWLTDLTPERVKSDTAGAVTGLPTWKKRTPSGYKTSSFGRVLPRRTEKRPTTAATSRKGLPPMARLFRQPYTRAIPEGAQIVTLKGKPHARYTEDGRTVTAPLTRKGDKIRLLSAKWYGEYRDANGIVQRVPLSEDRSAAEVMLGELV